MQLQNEEYLDYIRQLPCICEGPHEGGIQAHHEKLGEFNRFYPRLNDYLTIPLCLLHHAKRHEAGDVEIFFHKRAKSAGVKEYTYLVTLVLTLIASFAKLKGVFDDVIEAYEDAFEALTRYESDAITEAEVRRVLDEFTIKVHESLTEG